MSLREKRKKPCISIFLPYYNDEKFIRFSIESILEQTYSDFQLICFNHASTDRSEQIVKSYKDSRIIHTGIPINYGAGAGITFWQTLPLMQGKFVKVFCADDMMLPNHLEDLVQAFEHNSSLDFVVSPKIAYIDSNNLFLRSSHYTLDKKVINAKNPSFCLLEQFFNSISPIAWGNGLVKKEALTSLPKDNSMIYLFDMSFWVNLLISGKKVGFVDRDISLYRKSEQNILAENKDKIMQACFFEHLAYLRLFFHIKNVSLAKQLCTHVSDNIKNKIDESDVSLIPFLFALEYGHRSLASIYPKIPAMNLAYPIVMYEEIYSMLQNTEKRRQLQEKVGFSIKEFRELYLSLLHRNIFKKEKSLTRFIKKLDL